MAQTSYHASRRPRLLKELDGFAKLVLPDLRPRYGEQKATRTRQETLGEPEKLIPQFPYIGGDANPLTQNLVQAGYSLALYAVLRRYGGTVEQAGELSHLALERRLPRIPASVRHWLARRKFAPRNVRRMQERAETSQGRRHREDWVFEVVVGDGRTFDVGMDYTQCGIEKFMRRQGADELTPYPCNLDHVTCGTASVGLMRTKRLAWGCDFRIKPKGIAPPAWPPRFMERTCGAQRR